MPNIVSFFDQFPEFAGVKITVRGDDGYFDATEMGRAMTAFDGKKREFSRWTRNKFTQDLLTELSSVSGIPISWEGLDPQIWGSKQKPLIDYLPGKGARIWIHPYVAMSYAMNSPQLQARVNIWIVDLMRLGTVNPHILQWTAEEYQRGIDFNRDDINDMYR